MRESRRSGIAPFYVMEVLEKANAKERAGRERAASRGRTALDACPATVRERAAQLLASERLGHTDALGILPSRERIADHYGETARSGGHA